MESVFIKLPSSLKITAFKSSNEEKRKPETTLKSINTRQIDKGYLVTSFFMHRWVRSNKKNAIYCMRLVVPGRD